jgi:hypothetical protein
MLCTVTNKPLALKIGILIVSATIALLGAHYIRHNLIEPADMGLRCERFASIACQVRHWSILALQEGRIGWAALALVGFAFFANSIAVAVFAWVVACFALIFYTPEVGAVALLLAGLCAIRGAAISNQ